MTAEQDAVIRYRLDRARETLAEAGLMAGAGHWNACVNRLYYACFYAVSALLVRDGRTAGKHSAVRGFFNRYYVKPGVVDRDLGDVYNLLFNRRNRGDYADMVRFDESQVQPLMADAARFVARIEEIVGAPRPDVCDA